MRAGTERVSRRVTGKPDVLKAPTKPLGPCVLKIGEKWVNVETWKNSHPGGGEALERLRDSDCTEMFLSLHSPEAIAQVGRMKDVGPPANVPKEALANTTTLNFRKFRQQLEKEGFFERNWLWDSFYIGVMLTLCAAGTLLAATSPWIAVGLIGLGMQQAGWIGHDYVHGRGKLPYFLGRVVGGLINGFSAEWWSAKHNKHHVHTNQVGIDDDIANDPILHLWVPTPTNDYWFRRYQHWYYHLVYAALYLSWRMQSLQYAWARRERRGFAVELAFIAVNACWLAYLGPFVAFWGIVLGGWLVAEVVTATHQSEEMIEGISYQFAEDQFRTTRNVAIASGVGNWFWGGMQWQLEHHLFPTMPKYRYAQVAPLVKKFAEENKLSYRTSTTAEILRTNYLTMRRYATTSWQAFQAECRVGSTIAQMKARNRSE